RALTCVVLRISARRRPFQDGSCERVENFPVLRSRHGLGIQLRISLPPVASRRAWRRSHFHNDRPRVPAFSPSARGPGGRSTQRGRAGSSAHFSSPPETGHGAPTGHEHTIRIPTPWPRLSGVVRPFTGGSSGGSEVSRPIEEG